LRFGRDRLRHAMGREHRGCISIVGNFGKFLDENRALGPQAVHDIAVVGDLVTDIDRRAIDRQRALDGIDGADHPGAKAPRRTKHDSQVWFGHGSDLWTESPLAAGQGTVSSGYDLGLLSGGVKAVLSTIAPRPRGGLYRG